MTEIEITISDTEFTLRNGFSIGAPFPISVTASLMIDDSEVYSMSLEAVTDAKGTAVLVCVSDFMAVWFAENQSIYVTEFNENIFEYGFASPRADYDEHRSY